MIFLIASGIAKFNAYQNSGQSIAAIINQFPRTIQVIFGTDGFNLSKVSGYYGVLFLYISLAATIHALLFGTDIIAKEERDKTAEFLFVKPRSRAKIISIKLLAGLTNLIILNVVSLVTSLYVIHYFSHGQNITKDILLLMAGLFWLQLIFFFSGMAIASVNRNSKTSTSIATSLLLFTFILFYLINITSKLNFLKYLTPFKYFDAKTIITSNSLDMVNVIISIIIIVSLVVIIYQSYTKRDLLV